MQEACFCGRAGKISDRTARTDGDRRILECPVCGHEEILDNWQPAHLRESLWEAARSPAPIDLGQDYSSAPLSLLMRGLL